MRSSVGAILVLSAVSQAGAYEFRARFVERIGNVDTVLAGNVIDGSTGEARRIRLQVGVFDTGADPAPAGGFVGWNGGTIQVGGVAGSSHNTRTPGRLAPYVFSAQPTANGSPPLPGGDPFTFLDLIDATLGNQSPFWGCDASGNPLPLPQPIIRGRNTFVSLYEITTDPVAPITNYTITFAGNLNSTAEWRLGSTPFPPDCGDPADPDDDIPGSVTYFPLYDPVPFQGTLSVIIPAPSVGVLLTTGGLVAMRRRRSE